MIWHFYSNKAVLIAPVETDLQVAKLKDIS
jgi:hypothetical protein